MPPLDMPFDVRRVLRAAMEAALEEPPPLPTKKKKRRLPAGRALILGAGLATAGRLAASQRGQALLGSVRHGVSEVTNRDDGDEDLDHDVDPREELDEQDAELQDEPEAYEDEEDEDGEDEEDAEPQDEAELDEEPPRETAARHQSRGRARTRS